MNNIIPFYPSAQTKIVRSAGCYQYDSEGKRYIDFESGVWCANVGHSHPRITEIIEQQSKISVHHGYKFVNEYAEALSAELLRITELNEGASVFLSSGSEAVNLAITLARHITNKKKILKIDSSYLSAYGWGQISRDNEYLVNVRINDIDALSNIDFADISALVLEVGGASINMVQFPDNAFVRELVRLAKSNNCLVIAEEVTTGMGRTGKWFGFQHYDIHADIVVSGKALGNGYPISAVTVSNDLCDLFNTNPFRYAQSHQNDPLGCAIGLEVIKIIEDENLLETAVETGIYFESELTALRKKYPEFITDIRVKGLMSAMELSETINGEYIDQELFKAGFITGYKENNFRFMPPLTIDMSDIDEIIRQFDTLFSTIKS